MVTRAVVTVARVRFPVLEAGPPGEEAVVFVHGNPGSSRDWEDLAARAGQSGRAVALDVPGFGQADEPDTFDYTVRGYARHLGGCLAELGISRVHLVMHDLVEDPRSFDTYDRVRGGIRRCGPLRPVLCALVPCRVRGAPSMLASTGRG